MRKINKIKSENEFVTMAPSLRSIAGMRYLWQMKRTEIECYNTTSSSDFRSEEGVDVVNG